MAARRPSTFIPQDFGEDLEKAGTVERGEGDVPIPGHPQLHPRGGQETSGGGERLRGTLLQRHQLVRRQVRAEGLPLARGEVRPRQGDGNYYNCNYLMVYVSQGWS